MMGGKRKRSPPSPSKSIYMYGYHLHDRSFEWYRWNIDDDDEATRGVLVPLAPQLPHIPRVAGENPTFISLGSVIYLLGGRCRSRRCCQSHLCRVGESPDHCIHGRRAYYFDTSATARDGYDVATAQWSKTAPMIAERLRPAAVALDGKIYAFGGNYSESSPLFGEVFDPERNMWQPLPPPPPPLSMTFWSALRVTTSVSSSSSSSSRKQKQQILITTPEFEGVFEGMMIAYVVDDGRWECVYSDLGSHFASLAVADVLYTSSSSATCATYDPYDGVRMARVRAFDLLRDASLPVRHCGNGRRRHRLPQAPEDARLLHLGDDRLAFLHFLCCRGAARYGSSFAVLSPFRVERGFDSRGAMSHINLTVEPQKKFLIKSKPSLEECLVLV